ncbi:MAG: hypothetical protein ACI9W4_000076 [Rhodothermales bacterium]
MPRHRALSWLALFAIVGCDTGVYPRVEGDFDYSLYGVLNPRADTQAVVVIPIEATLEALSHSRSVTVTISDDHGETHVLTDSLVVKEMGPVNVYWSEFRAEYGALYTVTAADPESHRLSSAVVRVPPFTGVVLADPVFEFGVSQEIVLDGGLERLNFTEVVYEITARLPAAWRVYPVLVPGASEPVPVQPPASDSLVIQNLQVPISYVNRELYSGSDWRIKVNYTQDLLEIIRRLRRRGRMDATFGVQLRGINFSAVAANEEWAPPGNAFIKDELIQPGTLSNVTNGFGFIGAGYTIRHSYRLSDELLTRIGFRRPAR